MNTRSRPQLPRSAITAIKAMPEPRLSDEDRPSALRWLERILVDFDALDEHIAFLQELFGLPFTYPRPRRDAWTMEEIGPPAEAAAFPFNRLLDHDLIVAVADEGVNALQTYSNGRGHSARDELAELLLNPYGLYDLFDVLDELQPEHWVNVTANAGTAMADNASWASVAERFARHSWPLDNRSQASGTAALGAREWIALKEGIERAVKDSILNTVEKDGSVIQPGSKQQYVERLNTWWRPALALAVCAVCATSIATAFIGLRVFYREDAILDQVAILVQKPRTDLATPPGDSFAAFELQAAKARNADWEEIWTAAYSSELTDEQNLERIYKAVPDDAKMLIEEMRREGRSDVEILAYLHFKFIFEDRPH